MPLIKLKHVVSFSSEDKVFRADNLLNQDTYRKWKCAKPGEKSASVILQFEKASQIHSVDIGNEGSAFVELLVGRSSDSSQDFQIFMVSSSFQTPLESKNETNLNRVRMFGAESFSLPICKEKWDLVKVVCTQPYNKNIQYGLSFIKLSSPPEDASSPQSSTPTKLGAFKLKPSNSIDPPPSVGSWFNKRNSQEPNPITSPAAIRQATSLASAVLNSQKLVSFDPRPNQADKRKNKVDEADAPPSKKPNGAIPNSQKPSSSEKKKSSASPPATSLDVASTSRGSPPRNKPFHKLMEGVVFVLSGFQNPLRSQIRDKAISMGAKYKGDWDKSCTHLVCAFLNTPKYTQVAKLNGKIVKQAWIMECHKQKTLLPWTDFKLGPKSSPSGSSPSTLGTSKPSKRQASANVNLKLSSDEEDVDDDEADPVYEANTDVEDEDESDKSDIGGDVSQSEEDDVDTEEEIERFISNKKKKKKKKEMVKKEEEEDAELPHLTSRTNMKKQNIKEEYDKDVDDEMSQATFRKKVKNVKEDENDEMSELTPKKKLKKVKVEEDDEAGMSQIMPRKRPKMKEEEGDENEEAGMSQLMPKTKKQKIKEEENDDDQTGTSQLVLKKKVKKQKIKDEEEEDDEAGISQSKPKTKKPKIKDDDEAELVSDKKVKKEKIKVEEEEDNEEEVTGMSQIKPKKKPKEEAEPTVARVDTSSLPLPELPDFFRKKKFYLYGEFSPAEKRTLERYIIGFGGEIENYMSPEVKYVISRQKWDNNFDHALTENDNLVFVKPDWIFKCVDQEKLVPYQPHVVVPS